MIHLAFLSFLHEEAKWSNEKEEENNLGKAITKWRGRLHEHRWANCVAV